MTNKNSTPYEKKHVNPEFVHNANVMWTSAYSMFQYETNLTKGIFRLTSIFRIFAKSAANIEYIREQLPIAKKNNDLFAIKRLTMQYDGLAEDKALSRIYFENAEQFDECVRRAQEQAHASIADSILCAEEIFNQYFYGKQEAQLDKAKQEADSILAFIDL